MRIILCIIRLIVGFIGFNNWTLGLCLLVYVVWSLNSFSNIQSIASGESLITTGLLIFGSILSIKGLIGIYGTWRQHSAMLKMFLFLIILSISLEIGTFISLKISNVKLSDLAEQGWKEINGQTRNYVQKELKCCGFTGLSEFASKLDPIDESCYDNNNDVDDEVTLSNKMVADNNNNNNNKEPYRVGCKWKLIEWMKKKTKTFILIIGCLLGLQIISTVATIYLLKLLQHEKILQRQSSSLSSTGFNNSGGGNGENFKEILLDDF